MNLFSNILLVLSMVLNLFSAALPGAESEPVLSEDYTTPVIADIRLPERAVPTGTDWADMDYEHYDPSLFYAGLDELYTLADNGDTEGVLAQYDKLYTELSYIDTLSVIAYIQFSTDVADEYWSEESLYCDELLAETGDALSTACRDLLEGPIKDAFAAHIGPEAAACLAEYEPMTDRESELILRESELVNEYYETIAAAEEDAVYYYLGESWTWDKMDGFPGDNLYYDDYEGYLEVYYGLEAAVNAQVGPIFLELVSIRAELAELWGYASYADYAYESVYGRDYTTADAQALCDAVKEFSAGYYKDLYYSDLWYSYDEPSPVMDEDELVAALGETISLFGEDLTAVWQFMADHGLYELCSEPDSQSGAYTTELAYYQSPFIYEGLAGDCYDFSTLTHEFGHFADAYYHPIPNLLTAVGSYDLFEIHSTGLEALFTELYDAVYTTGADTARFITLGGLVESVLDGCIYDEFQRRVYENPDMTLEEINELFADIYTEYGMYGPMDVDYSWMYVSHNYDAPLYYISYAVSALAALQLWDMAQENFAAAVESYLAILGQGAYWDGYLTVLQNAGLRLFTEPGAVEDICGPVLKELEYLDRTAW